MDAFRGLKTLLLSKKLYIRSGLQSFKELLSDISNTYDQYHNSHLKF